MWFTLFPIGEHCWLVIQPHVYLQVLFSNAAAQPVSSLPVAMYGVINKFLLFQKYSLSVQIFAHIWIFKKLFPIKENKNYSQQKVQRKKFMQFPPDSIKKI